MKVPGFRDPSSSPDSVRKRLTAMPLPRWFAACTAACAPLPSCVCHELHTSLRSLTGGVLKYRGLTCQNFNVTRSATMSTLTDAQIGRIVDAATAAWHTLAAAVPMSVLRGDELAFKAAFLDKLMHAGFGVLEAKSMIYRADGKLLFFSFDRPLLTTKPDVVVVDMRVSTFDLAAPRVSRASIIVIEEKFYRLAPFSRNECLLNGKNGYLADMNHVATSKADIALLWCAASAKIGSQVTRVNGAQFAADWTLCDKDEPSVEVKRIVSVPLPFPICKKGGKPKTLTAALYVFRRSATASPTQAKLAAPAAAAAAASTPAPVKGVKGGKAARPATDPKTKVGSAAAASSTPAQSSAKVRAGTGPAKASSGQTGLVSRIRKLKLDDDGDDDDDDDDSDKEVEDEDEDEDDDEADNLSSN